MSAPFIFFADRTPVSFPYFHTECFGSNRMFAFVRRGIFIFGICPSLSSP